MELFPNFSRISFERHYSVFGDGYWDGDYKNSFSFRGMAHKKVSDKFNFTLGFGAQFSGEKTISTRYYSGVPSENGTFNYYSHYHSLQFLTGYNIYLGKNFYLHSGMNLLYNYSLTTDDENWYQSKTVFRHATYQDPLRNFTISAELGIGFDFFKDEKITLYIQPTVEQTLINHFKNIDKQDKPLMLGIVIGIKI